MNKLFVLLIAVAIIAMSNTGCKSGGKKESGAEGTCMTVDSFLLAPDQWAGKDITIKGTVSHVCRHSGKKLFLFTADPGKTIKVNAAGDISSFDIKYEGADLEVTGTVVEDQKIDANYLDEWEKEIKNSLGDKPQSACDADSKAMTSQTNEKTDAGQSPDDPYADVKGYRNKLEKSGKGYISIYAVNVKTLKELTKLK